MATSGGWVMQVVATSRGAPARVLRPPDASAADVARAVGEDHVREHAVGPLPAEQRAQLVGGARCGSKRAMPMAVKHESHSHWCG